MDLLFIPLLPLTAVFLSLIPAGKRFPAAVTLIAESVAFVLTLHVTLQVLILKTVVAVPNWIGIDGLSAVVLLLSTFVGATAALFSWGYVLSHVREERRMRFYYAHFNLFVFSLIAVPIIVEPAFVWIAIEFTAMFSVLLVAFDNTREALEAAWKYIVLMFMGAAIALLGFLILFWAQQKAGGGPFTWSGLDAVAVYMPAKLIKISFLLILVGFGIKVGFVPLHTWLPDAHSQAPSPVCALLSGIKTTAALYVILRLIPLLPDGRAGLWMQIIGLISVGTAAFLLLQVRDYKRLFAYSTVEHMGIIFFAVGISAGGGYYAALQQIVSHGLTKSFCFFAAGAVLLIFGTREIKSIRGLIRTSPVAGCALLFGALAIGGAPPFAVFLSEFSIFRAGLTQGATIATTILIFFIVVAFFGILMHVNRMVFGPADADTAAVHAALPLACVLALCLAAIPIVLLGVYEPVQLHRLFALAASNIGRMVSP